MACRRANEPPCGSGGSPTSEREEDVVLVARVPAFGENQASLVERAGLFLGWVVCLFLSANPGPVLRALTG